MWSIKFHTETKVNNDWRENTAVMAATKKKSKGRRPERGFPPPPPPAGGWRGRCAGACCCCWGSIPFVYFPRNFRFMLISFLVLLLYYCSLFLQSFDFWTIYTIYFFTYFFYFFASTWQFPFYFFSSATKYVNYKWKEMNLISSVYTTL